MININRLIWKAPFVLEVYTNCNPAPWISDCIMIQRCQKFHKSLLCMSIPLACVMFYNLMWCHSSKELYIFRNLTNVLAEWSLKCTIVQQVLLSNKTRMMFYKLCLHERASLASRYKDLLAFATSHIHKGLQSYSSKRLVLLPIG